MMSDVLAYRIAQLADKVDACKAEAETIAHDPELRPVLKAAIAGAIDGLKQAALHTKAARWSTEHKEEQEET